MQKKWKFVVAFLVILSAIYLTHPLYLKALGHFLVVSDPLVKADAIVVLDGDPMDERLLHSVQLWRSGYAPNVTSNYHTWRTKSVYEQAWRDGDIRFYISPAYSSQFHPDEWWKHRADSRTFFYEFSKIIWYAFAE